MNTVTTIHEVRPTLCVAGHMHRDWLRYSVDSGFFTPADGWSVSLGLPDGKLPSWLELWAEVELAFDGVVALTGRIDHIRHSVNTKGHSLDLSGRDKAGMLLDCSAPIFVTQQVTLPELIATVVRPLGIDSIEVNSLSTLLFQKSTVEPGMTAWQAIQEAASVNGLWPWFTPDGTLTIDRPDYSTSPVACLTLRQSGVGNNVLELNITHDIGKQYSAVTVLSQSQGNEISQAVTTLKSVALDPDAPFRPLLLRKGHIDNTQFLTNIADNTINEGKLKGLTVTAKVQGHFVEPGLLWEPGQRVTIFSEPHEIDETFFLTSRTFIGSRFGTFTLLKLQKDKLWLHT